MNSSLLNVLERVRFAASCEYRRGDEDLSALFGEAAVEIERLTSALETDEDIQK